MKPNRKNVLQVIVLHIVMTGFALVTLLPFFWMLSASLMQSGEASVFPPRFLPETITFNNYLQLYEKLNVTRFFLNSLILSVSVQFQHVPF